MLLYHGSDHVIEKPEFGAGKKHNDYGKGFYCTENIAQFIMKNSSAAA